ncbi:inactive serine/threonine-protein kinase TEX14 isoform X5 [Mixophyes fleayi]|uniref:inactive serine/threonine-protein kinase TEX14 isoform X5 n=1 Tax=Mixophyes fleayi TaxID=3061075 RepID=UPI003F4E426C
MSRSNINLPPYPVQIGSIKFDSNEKQLHQYVKCGNYDKTKKMLKKDIDVDSTNSLGQTPLFVASLLGLQKIVDLLMEFRSNPNYRCFDWSTPVHAAAFSCNQWIMSRLIDAGGDLRLHDQKCRRPYDWALMAGNDQSAQMLKFIDQCFAHMQALIHCYPLKPLRIASSRELIINPSLIDLLSPRNANKSVSRVHKWERISVKKTCSFGYGQFCLKNDIQAGFVLTIPFIEDKSIVQEDCKPTFTFSAGTYMIMTNLLWESTEVTVKELSGMAHRNCNKEPFLDLLIAEQENISNLQHPLILQLLALCTSPSLERTRLVFERVAFGSLYNILHERRSEIPILHMETIIHLLLQMIDALIFLHWRGFIHRSFSSHAIQIVSAGKAKLSNFEYMIERKEDREFNNVIQFPIPKQLYCWSSPEIVLGKIISVKSDLYSLCVVMQESLTESLPWNGLDGQTIRDAMESGHYLSVDPRLFKPYDSIVSTGIQANPDERTMTFQDIRYLLKNDFKIYTPFNERSSKNSNICKHDDEGIVTNRLCTKAASAQQWLSNISIRGELTPTWNSANSGRQCLQNMKLCEYVNDKETEEQTQESSKIWGQEDQEDKLEKLLRQFSGKRHKSQKDEKHCEIPKGVKPSRDHTKNIDVSVCSSETSYFTPELELSAENSEQETLNVCDESDKFIKECLPEQSFSCSRNDTICGQEKKSFMSWTGDRTFEMSMPGVTTLTISPKTRSIVDVEELSSISCGYKSPSKNLPTSKSTEASARHSTPVSPDKIKSDCKVRSLQENSCDTSCWTSLEYSPSNENISTKCSEPFLSPLTTSDFIDCNDVSSLKKKTSSILGHTTGITPCKSQELGSYEDALLGSYCLLNKTKQAMEEESAIEKEVVPDLSPEEEEPAQYSEADEESVKYHKAEEEPAQYPEVDKEPAQYPEAEREPALLPEKEPGPSPKQRTWVGDLHVIRESEEDELHQGAAHVQNPQEEGNLRREMLRAYVNDIHRQFGVVNFALGQVMELIVDVINFYFFSILMSVKLLFN